MIYKKKTFESIDRISSNIAEIQSIASMSLKELRANSDQIDDIIDESN
jgi:hypothetical protein